MLGPVDREAPERIERGGDLDPAVIVAQRTVFGRIGDHLVDHQRHRGECLRFDQHIRTADDDAIRLAGKVGAGFRVDQAAKRGRAPIVGGDLIVRHRQRVDATAEHLGEGLDVGRRILALGDDATDQPQNVADAMIELRDQQLLTLLRASALGLREIGQAQDHFEQAHAQRLGDAALDRQPGRRLSAHRLPPELETLARRKPCAVRS